jgi:transcriptional regulator with XRE-family HTH domain
MVKKNRTETLSPGEVLKKLRLRKGWTQKELAALTGIAETNLSNIERGNARLGEDRAIFLAEALGVRPERLLFPKGFEREDLVPRIRKIKRHVKQMKRPKR